MEIPEYSVIETRIATGVVALDQDNRIYLVGQYRYPTRQYSWEIPEGGTDPNETPLQAAKRELREEAGLEAREFSQLGAPLHLSNCLSAEVGVLFLARGLVEVERDPDPTEILEVRRIAFESALKMVDVGEITDAMSVIGILRAARL